MATRMLIDASYPEETRVVVIKGKRLEEFDFETASRKPLKGNIYLAKVTRVEPSLQAAFVDYGGNRHGFLAFSEIHPDYYQIPLEDREALIAQEQADAAEDAEAEEQAADAEAGAAEAEDETDVVDADADDADAEDTSAEDDAENASAAGDDAADDDAADDDAADDDAADDDAADEKSRDDADGDDAEDAEDEDRGGTTAPARRRGKHIESVGGDALDEATERPRPRRRSYKIQEVIKRRQILLVQVVKEERGNKGAALTSYLSLAGRYCVLMPNTGRGGGISRKITSLTDRKRLKTIAKDLEVPDGMGVIVRTAGMSRSKAEIKRDFEYLLRLWEQIRDLTLQSTAPALVYEEANQIKRAIRDLYTKDLEEVLIEGEDGYRTAKDFMRMLMPSHAKRVKQYKDRIPLFHRYQIEQQLDAMYSPVITLPSGGYIVINATEALIAIDVNSGKSTKQRNIEETALTTNLEAAEDIARQLRLRDLAGLIVIDFIDMEVNRNNRAVERKIKECLKADRARIQVGRISGFGLLEMSRQRLRPGMHEVTMETCRHCGGAGVVRSTDSTALHVLRAIEEEGMRERTEAIGVHVPTNVAIYILNQKRQALADIEARYGFSVAVEPDDELIPPDHRIERLRTRTGPAKKIEAVVPEAEEIEAEVAAPEEAEAEATAEDQDDGKGKRRRRRRRRKKPGEAEAAEAVSAEAAAPAPEEAAEPAEAAAEADESAAAEEPEAAAEETEDTESAAQRRRRRGRRAGRRRTRKPSTEAAEAEAAEAETADDAEAAEETAVEEAEPVAAAMPVAEAETAEAPDQAADEAPAAEERSAPAEEPIVVEEAPEEEPVVAEAPAEEPVAEEPAPESEVIPLPAAPAEAVDAVLETEAATAEEEMAEDEMAEGDTPARRGWWRRRG